MPRAPRRANPKPKPKRTKANMLVRMFDDDEAKSKGEEIRRRMIGKGLVRRDAKGDKIAEHRLDEDKGKPPKRAPRVKAKP